MMSTVKSASRRCSKFAVFSAAGRAPMVYKMDLEFLESRRLLAGVTILTHGHQGNITGWIDEAADAIQNRLGGTSAASQYVMKVENGGVSSFTLEDGNKPLDQTSRGEAIVKLDWSDIANTSNFTDDIAEEIANYIL